MGEIQPGGQPLLHVIVPGHIIEKVSYIAVKRAEQGIVLPRLVSEYSSGFENSAYDS